MLHHLTHNTAPQKSTRHFSPTVGNITFHIDWLRSRVFFHVNHARALSCCTRIFLSWRNLKITNWNRFYPTRFTCVHCVRQL